MSSTGTPEDMEVDNGSSAPTHADSEHWPRADNDEDSSSDEGDPPVISAPPPASDTLVSEGGSGLVTAEKKELPSQLVGPAGLEADEEDRAAEQQWRKAEGSSAQVTTDESLPWRMSRWSERDTNNYRKGYQGKRDGAGSKNVQFYMNQRRCQPDDMLIDEIHTKWWGSYSLLEYNHGYIQWLFPIRERGLNWEAQELFQHEIEKICADDKAHKRVLTSYKMMLDFYGMQLLSEDTGEIARAPNWQERFENLNWSMHNYLRITRMLKCLGELNYEHLKQPFVKFILREAIEHGTLIRTLDSCMNYWVQVLRDDKERKEVLKFAEQLQKTSSSVRTKSGTPV